LQYQELLERVITFTLCTIPSCVFLCINGTVLFTLRSKSVFRDTCRYVLLYNTLFADTVQLMVSQVLFLLAVCRIRLTYPVCGILTRIATLFNVISPLTLLVMSLESWRLEMKDFCSDLAMLLGPRSKDYNRGFTIFLFASAELVIISSYFGVIKAARSASTDKSLALKARHTLLLHLVELCLSMSSTIFNPLLLPILRVVTREVFARIHKFLYVLIILFPTCLSALIYGLRDQTIRLVLLHHLSCRVKVKLVAANG
ncbi:hypothetical protein XENOCAPTIV_007926, partial [Xenoophorus captivus]